MKFAPSKTPFILNILKLIMHNLSIQTQTLLQFTLINYQIIYIKFWMISLKLIKKEQYDELLQKDSRFLQVISGLQDSNTLLSSHLQDLKTECNQLKQKNDQLFQQKEKYLNQINQINNILDEKNLECINLKSEIESYKVERNQTQIKTNQLKACKNQIQIRFANLKMQQKSYQLQLTNLIQKNEEYKAISQDLQRDISELVQKNSQLELKYDLLTQELKLQNYETLLRLQQIERLKQLISLLQEKTCKMSESPEAKLKQQLAANQQWIKHLTKQHNQLKQKFIEKEVQKQKYPASNSTNPIYKSSQQDFQRAKYIQICKTILHQFNSKIQKIQKQKQKMENKYKIISLKLNQYQYKQFKYNDRISHYLQKIQGYEKLAAKQQNQLQKIINEFDRELDNVVKLKQCQMQNKIQNLDTFQIQILTNQLERVRQDFKRLKKQKKKNNQSMVLLQQENYNQTIQIRMLKGYNHDLVTQLQIRTNQVQILKAKILSNGSYTNRSQEQLLSTISRLSNKNTNGKISSGQDRYEYQVSQIDTQKQKENQKLMRMLSPRIYYKSNPGIPDQIQEDAKKLQESLISESSSSKSNDSSQCLSSEQSLNDSNGSKVTSKSYAMKQNYSYKSKLNPDSKFLMHKNSLN